MDHGLVDQLMPKKADLVALQRRILSWQAAHIGVCMQSQEQWRGEPKHVLEERIEMERAGEGMGENGRDEREWERTGEEATGQDRRGGAEHGEARSTEEGVRRQAHGSRTAADTSERRGEVRAGPRGQERQRYGPWFALEAMTLMVVEPGGAKVEAEDEGVEAGRLRRLQVRQRVYERVCLAHHLRQIAVGRSMDEFELSLVLAEHVGPAKGTDERVGLASAPEGAIDEARGRKNSLW